MKKIAWLLIFLLAMPPAVLADWLCPKTLNTFPTQSDCQTFCPGAECIESGTYMCSADTDGDGETELYQCQQVYQCPLGDYPCDENNVCSRQGTCTAQEKGVCKISYYSGYYVASCTTSPDGTCCYNADRATWCFRFDDSCNIIAIWDSISQTWHSYSLPYGAEDCWDVGDYYVWYVCRKNESTYTVEYICSLDKSTYSSESECNTACVQTAACTSSWKCPVEGGTECIDISVPENYQDEPPDLSYYRDDGATDSTGECLGQILIFNGRPMMCRRSGLQTGFHNCCDADDEVVQQMRTSLSSLGGTFAVISKAKDAISIASQTYQAYQALNSGVPAIKVASNFNWSPTAINSAIDAFNAGKSVTDAMSSALQAIGISPTGIIANIAINFAMDFAMKILFSGCSEDDIITASYNELGLCHYIGDKCVKKLPIIGCVQKANIYCCFNSKLARIIHEQGRTQLKNFGGWGNADYPNCRGFSPEEFQMLDFSKIDLSEWYGDVEVRAQSEIQQNMQQNLNNFKQNIR